MIPERRASGVREKDVTLAVALAIRDAVLAKGRLRVALTRSDDRYLLLGERPEIARAFGWRPVRVDPCRQRRRHRGDGLHLVGNRVGPRCGARCGTRERRRAARPMMPRSLRSLAIWRATSGLAARSPLPSACMPRARFRSSPNGAARPISSCCAARTARPCCSNSAISAIPPMSARLQSPEGARGDRRAVAQRRRSVPRDAQVTGASRRRC